MAFYGNVTNTSKTTFSFDKTYSNRYEMDLNANRDGVFVGRYVLVDYDAGLKSASYILDKGNEHLYLYDNAETADAFNLYTNEPHYELDKYKNKIYTSADHYSFYEFKKDLDNGRCLVFHPKHVIKECNRESLYVRATKWLATENASVFFMGYEYVDKNAYLKYWEDNPDAQYIPVELNEFSYEPYLFYYRDVETGKFKLCETAMFDPDIEYYDLGDGNHNKVGIVDGNGIYFGTGEPDFTGKTIYRIDKGMKYNRNAELEYWAIVGWSTATRWVQNPNYNIADPKNNQPLIEAFIDVPVWGQLAAVKGSVDTTYELVEKPDLTKIDDYYVLEKEDSSITWLVPNAQKNEMEPILIELPQGGESFVMDPHSGEEFGYVLEGAVILMAGEDRHIVHKGETFYLSGKTRHYLKNEKKTTAKVLWVSTPPLF